MKLADVDGLMVINEYLIHFPLTVFPSQTFQELLCRMIYGHTGEAQL